MTNIVQQQEQLKNLSDDQIANEMKQPSGQMPLFLVSTEAKRRADLRERFKQDKAEAPQTSVQEDLLRSIMAGQMQPPGTGQGITQGMQQPQMQQPQQMMQQPQMQPPQMQAPQMMPQAGAMQGVPPQGQGFAVGGAVRGYAQGGMGRYVNEFDAPTLAQRFAILRAKGYNPTGGLMPSAAGFENLPPDADAFRDPMFDRLGRTPSRKAPSTAVAATRPMAEYGTLIPDDATNRNPIYERLGRMSPEAEIARTVAAARPPINVAANPLVNAAASPSAEIARTVAAAGPTTSVEAADPSGSYVPNPNLLRRFAAPNKNLTASSVAGEGFDAPRLFELNDYMPSTIVTPNLAGLDTEMSHPANILAPPPSAVVADTAPAISPLQLAKNARTALLNNGAPRTKAEQAGLGALNGPEFEKVKSEVDYAKEKASELARLQGRPDPYADLATRLTERETDLEEDTDQNKWMALAKAGFSMAGGTSQNALENIGKGGIAGLEEYVSGKKDLDARAERNLDSRTQLIGVQEQRRNRLQELAGQHAQGLISDEQRGNEASRINNDSAYKTFTIEENSRQFELARLDKIAADTVAFEQSKETAQTLAKTRKEELLITNSRDPEALKISKSILTMPEGTEEERKLKRDLIKWHDPSNKTEAALKKEAHVVWMKAVAATDGGTVKEISEKYSQMGGSQLLLSYWQTVAGGIKPPKSLGEKREPIETSTGD